MSYRERQICNRCLINADVRNSLKAIIMATGKSEWCPFVTDPKSLKEWAVKQIEQGAVFEMNAWANVIIPITTWNGDPVCVMHLWEMRDRELGRTKWK